MFLISQRQNTPEKKKKFSPLKPQAILLRLFSSMQSINILQKIEINYQEN